MTIGFDGRLYSTLLIDEARDHEQNGPSVIIGILVMLTLWLGALFNIGDITFTISRLFHWIESQRG
ncbi:hypothetical protein J4732_05080 [Serratia marcescens]|uniref:Uncharacterized protein n=1 Tax=Serratia marcescens TaxID=615 RepID=A0A939SQZ8_SERMA|nr:hypothetical protein [Serratia marcescens]